MAIDYNYNKRILLEKNRNPFISQTDLVYNLLRDDIMHRYRRQGSKIDQGQLAALMHVSRSPIRDAINRLIEDNLLVKRGKRGYYVYIPTMKDVTYVSEFRTAIEINAALLAIKRMTDQDLEFLHQNIREQSECNRQDLDKMITLDMEFHDHLVSCSKSEYIIQTYKHYTTQIRHLHNRIVSMSMRGIIFSQHKSILSAIENKDAARLESSMRTHLNIAEDFMQAPECHYA